MRKFWLAPPAALALAMCLPAGAQASPCVAGDVCAGYDLFHTPNPPGATFGGLTFEGVPLGSFDFGGSIGVRGTGSTDTIVQRLDDVIVSGGATGLLIRALQLKSTVEVGGHFLFASLGTIVQSPGSMTIGLPSPNTFGSVLPVAFQITEDSFGGPDAGLCGTPNVCVTEFTATGTWDRPAPPGTVLIAGANFMLDGVGIGGDFWPAQFQECSGPNNCHPVDPPVRNPEPGTLALLGIALLGLAGLRRRRS